MCVEAPRRASRWGGDRSRVDGGAGMQISDGGGEVGRIDVKVARSGRIDVKVTG
jgi:hypothetical protein